MIVGFPKKCREPGAQGMKSTGESSNNPMETALRNCRFLSPVVVETVLICAWQAADLISILLSFDA